MRKLIFLTMFAQALLALTACGQNGNTVSRVNYKDSELSKYSQATFAAGCFWHEEAMFESVKGVIEVISGYAGGTSNNPSYASIETGLTGHAETVNVYYDSTLISYSMLLKIYFSGQDPTQVNGQGADVGTQYRSIIFFKTDNEKALIDQYMKSIRRKYRKPLATEVMPLTKFWPAEPYHQNYIDKYPSGAYVRNVSIPEIKKVQREYPDLIKPDRIY